jgi:uncharacterized protein (DUF302 family)
MMMQGIMQANDKPTQIGYSTVYSIEDEKWSDVNEEIQNVIKSRGIVISYTSHAKELLDRTAKVVGTKQNTYLGAQMHLFCKVATSHRMIKINPHVITGCPYSIAVYELKSKPGTIYVSYRSFDEKIEPAFKEANKLQDSIIREALDL